MEPVRLYHPNEDTHPGTAVVVRPWTAFTQDEQPMAQPGQTVHLCVNHMHLARCKTALVVEPPRNGRLSMGKTAHNDEDGERMPGLHLEREDNELARLLVFIPMKALLSDCSPLRHALLFTRVMFLRRTSASAVIFTAAYIPNADGSACSQWSGCVRKTRGWGGGGEGEGQGGELMG